MAKRLGWVRLFPVLLLLAVAALIPDTAAAAEKGFFRSCMLKDLEESNSIVPFNERKEHETPKQALLVAVAEGEQPLAQVRCDTNGPPSAFFGPVPEKEHYQIEMAVAGGKKIPFNSSKARPRWVVPVKSGENQVTVSFHDAKHPQLGEQRMTLNFSAYVYTLRSSGVLKSPFEDPKQNITNIITDPQGNIYAVVSSSRQKALVRFAPDGRLAARYDIGAPDPKYGHQGAIMPLFADDRGHLFASVHNNIIEYGKDGRFIRSHGAFGMSGAVNSAADLAPGTKRVFDRDRPAEWQRIKKLHLNSPPVVANGAVYFIAEVYEQAAYFALVRYQVGGMPEIVARLAGDATPYRYVEGMVPAPGGDIHVKVRGDGGQPLAMLAVNPASGKVSLLQKLPTGNKVAPADKPLAMAAGGILKGMDGGGYYLSEGFRLARDFGKVSGRPLNNQSLRYRHVLDSSGQYRDRISSEVVGARDKAFQKATWVHRGDVYVAYNDMRVLRFSLQGDGGVPAPQQMRAAAAASAQLEIARIDGELARGAVLDGRTPLQLEARFTAGDGKPRADVTLNGKLWQRLPEEGRLEWPDGHRTDSNGRVRLTFIPPRVTRAGMQAGKWAPEVRLTLSAEVKDAAEVQARIPLHGVMDLNLSVERPGFAGIETLPVELEDPRGGPVSGRVVFRLGAMLNAGQVSQERDVPIRGALVRLSDAEGGLMAEGLTDADGIFVLQAGEPEGAGETLLAEPLVLTDFDPETLYFVQRILSVLQDMGGANYGYDVSSLRAGFLPGLVAELASVEPAGVPAVRSRMVRLGLLAAALRESHDLALHCSERFAESLVNVMNGLADIGDPLGDNNLGALIGPGDGGEDLGRKMLNEGKGLKNRLARWIFDELEKKFTSVMAGAQSVKKDVGWYWAKKLLMKAVSDTAANPWQKQLVDGLMEAYRAETSKYLKLAAAAWQNGTLGAGEQAEQAIRERYAALAESIRQVSQLQLDLDLYKADIDLGFDVIGQSLVALATIKAGPTAAEQVSGALDLFGKGLKTLTTGADAYVGFQWLMDYDQAMTAISGFSQTVLVL